ncbi:MAG: hypothetical protein ACRDZY_02225 [Acidimicrobiales bacterium]
MAVHATYVGSVTDNDAIHYVFRANEGPVGRDLDARSLRVLASARHLVGVRTGTLLATLRRARGETAIGPYADVTAGLSGITNYLGYHMDGTPPHLITPSRRKALRFLSGGQVVFARVVHHPGTRANPFLVRALEAAR